MVFKQRSRQQSESNVCLQNKFTVKSKFSFSLEMKIERAAREISTWNNTVCTMLLPMNPELFISANAKWSATWWSNFLRLIVFDFHGHVLKLLESRTSRSLFYPFLTFRRNFMAFVSSGSAFSCVLRIQSWFRNTSETPVYYGHFVFAWIVHYSLRRRWINME